MFIDSLYFTFGELPISFSVDMIIGFLDFYTL